MNIPDYLKIISTRLVAHSYAGDVIESIRDLEKEGTLIVDWAPRTSSGIPYVATVYICEPKGSGL